MSENKKELYQHFAMASSSSITALKLNAVPISNPNDTVKKAETVDLGNGSDVVFIQRLIPSEQSWKWFHYLDKHIPWTRPTIRVFGKSFLQVTLSSFQPSPNSGLPQKSHFFVLHSMLLAINPNL
jgi:hypothetical protein